MGAQTAVQMFLDISINWLEECRGFTEEVLVPGERLFQSRFRRESLGWAAECLCLLRPDPEYLTSAQRLRGSWEAEKTLSAGTIEMWGHRLLCSNDPGDRGVPIARRGGNCTDSEDLLWSLTSFEPAVENLAQHALHPSPALISQAPTH